MANSLEDLNLTAEQIQAIESQEQEFVVLASAGSGKTTVLTERYLRFIEQGQISPEQILTITFTKKAAAEMKSRIVRKLRDRGMHHEAQVAETGPIQTIHSFCERILRENVLECGLDPGFDILTESRASKLKLDCIRQAIVEAPDESPEAEPCIRDFTGQMRFNSGGNPYRHLESCIASVVDDLRSSGWTAQQIEDRYASPDAVREFWEDTVLAEIPHEGVRSAAKTIVGGTLANRIVQAYKMLDLKAPKQYSSTLDLEQEQTSIQHTCGIVLLACAAWRKLEAKMYVLQALDFTLLESKAVNLLRDSEVTRQRLAEQYKVVMVDEVQDVNPVQFNLLNSLKGVPRMYVGDVKQSIYAFRHADVKRFEVESERLTKIVLSKNFRSKVGIQRYVDDLFGQLMGERYERMTPPPVTLFDADDPFAMDEPYADVEHWQVTKDDHSAIANYVNELILGGTKESEIAVIVQSNDMASKIEAALNRIGIGCRVAGGSEKFYTRLEVRDLSNALRAVADPYDDFSLLATLRGQMVGLSLDAIVLLSQSRPVLEALSTFESPVAEDAEKLARFLSWYRPLRDITDRMSAWEVLSELFSKSGYLEALATRPNSAQQLANVRKLLLLAASEPELGPLEYAENIRETIELRHREGDAPISSDGDPLVTIMTVHKAKGLEFGTVIVAETYRSLGGRADEIAIDAPAGRIAVKLGAVPPSAMYTAIKARKANLELDERLRVLYVALTRAKDRLCICIYPRTNRDTMSRRIQTVMGDNPPGVLVRQRKEDIQPST